MITINVTEEHIAKGKRRNCRSCPIALAIKQKFNCEDVEVGYVMFIKNYKFDNPTKVDTFIFDFDNGFPVKPFNFDLPTNGDEFVLV